ncbi:MAG: DUF4175 family protein, partial [Amphiplicatus sp.]|nr:DUF4175 family protein [Amphiplicatus sp.]
MASIETTLNRLVARARVTLAWEFLWRALSTVAGIAALFLAITWLGVWNFVPPAARAFCVLAFLIIILAALAREARHAALSRRDALRRIDLDAGDSYAAASTLEDSPANSNDPTAMALWRVHRTRVARRLRTVRLSAPAPRAVDRDRWALRAGAVLLAIAAGIFAGPDRNARLAAAFVWSGDGLG